MMWDGWGFSWIGMGMMMFFGLLVLIGIVMLIVWIARSAGAGGGMHYGGHYGGPDGRSRACDIARERYARGEINKEQYDEICKTVSA